jgi:hypothetical protein
MASVLKNCLEVAHGRKIILARPKSSVTFRNMPPIYDEELLALLQTPSPEDQLQIGTTVYLLQRS